MRFSQSQWDKMVEAHRASLETCPGVRVTRRYALKVGALGALAGLVACEGPDGGLSPSVLAPDGANGHHGGLDVGTTMAPNDAKGAAAGSAEMDAAQPGAIDAQGALADTGPGGSFEDAAAGSDLAPLSLTELMALVGPAAEELVAASDPDDLGFLSYVAELMPRLQVTLSNQNAQNWDMNTLFAQGPVEVFELEMAPGAQIPLHDHRDYIGVLLGMGGEVHCANYTRVGEPSPPGAEFMLQKTAEEILTPGKASYLGLELHNFHVVTAGDERARLVDLFTFFPGGDGHSYWADLDPEPVDAENAIYRAWWR